MGESGIPIRKLPLPLGTDSTFLFTYYFLIHLMIISY